MTEWGATDNAQALEIDADAADAHNMGWLYWAYKHWDDPTTADTAQGLFIDDADLSTIKKDKLRQLVRTYPQATAGRDLTYQLRPDDRPFTMRYSRSCQIDAPTRIFVSPLPRRTGTTCAVDQRTEPSRTARTSTSTTPTSRTAGTVSDQSTPGVDGNTAPGWNVLLSDVPVGSGRHTRARVGGSQGIQGGRHAEQQPRLHPGRGLQRRRNAYGNTTYPANGRRTPPTATPRSGGPARLAQATQVDQGRMTIDSVVQKTGITLGIVVLVAAATWVLTGDVDDPTRPADASTRSRWWAPSAASRCRW